MRSTYILVVLVLFAFTVHAQKPAQHKETNNVIIITLDGLRWQEMFTGADSIIINDSGYTRNPTRAKEKYWAATPEQRRQKLFPFIWGTIAGEGQIHGNRLAGSKVNVLNEYRYSYPGYNEMFTGFPNDTTG